MIVFDYYTKYTIMTVVLIDRIEKNNKKLTVSSVLFIRYMSIRSSNLYKKREKDHKLHVSIDYKNILFLVN